MAESAVRTMTLTDIPLLTLSNGQGVLLDSEVAFTRDTPDRHSHVLSSILFRRGLHTLITRSSPYLFGQLRHHPDNTCAHIVYIAPDREDAAGRYLAMLDALAREAGKHGAHFLIAEIDPEHHLYETLRRTRFASYARQMIWRHPATRKEHNTLSLHTPVQQDRIGITSLLYDIIPTMLQHVALPGSEMKGLIYRHEGQIAAYIAYSEGERGTYLLPFIHTDIADMAEDILNAAGMHISQTRNLPQYICVRSYQYWLDSTLDRMNFTPWGEQVMMVRHIAAGVHQPEFQTGKLRLQGKPATAPPSWSIMLPDNNEEKSNIYGKTETNH